MKRLTGLAVLIILVIAFGIGCSKQVFNGNRTSNDKQFIMNYTILNREETQNLKLYEGTTVNVNIENKSGKLKVLVTDSRGEEIYRADNAATGKFSIQISKTDSYKFSVTGKKANGGVSFKVE